MAPRKVIIDTDPGVDDILAILLALSSSGDELELLLISLTFGNIDVQNCLRNTISAFKVIEKEQAWRASQSRNIGFESLASCKPIVAVGANEPLHQQVMVADFFYGADGLGNVHKSHPHFTPQESWQSLFSDSPFPHVSEETIASPLQATNFIPSKLPAHKEIIRILRENPDRTVTIAAVGPLTNLALAADEDPEALLRAQEVICMGGAISLPGNVTPMAEFNFSADAFAAAQVFALTSLIPMSTMPPIPATSASLPSSKIPFKKRLSRSLNVTIFPLDLTTFHLLKRSSFSSFIEPLLLAGSPLAAWAEAFMSATFNKVSSQLPPSSSASGEGDGPKVDTLQDKDASLNMHDPLTIWYILAYGSSATPEQANWVFSPKQDIRIETVGQWTRGMCVLDRRHQPILSREEARRAGNFIRVCEKTGWEEAFSDEMLRRIFL